MGEGSQAHATELRFLEERATKRSLNISGLEREGISLLRKIEKGSNQIK